MSNGIYQGDANMILDGIITVILPMPKTTKPLDPLLAGMPERAKAAREALGLGARELGELSGNGIAFVSRLENKKRVGGLAIAGLVAHARALGVNLQWLVTGEGPQRVDGRYLVVELTPGVLKALQEAKADSGPASSRRQKVAD